MSPSSSVARPVWVWSLPAVAIIISFLWYRKKRHTLQTDTGLTGEPAKKPIPNETPDVQVISEGSEQIEQLLDVGTQVDCAVATSAEEVEAQAQLELCVQAEVEVVQEVCTKEQVDEVCVKTEIDNLCAQVEELYIKEAIVEEVYVKAEADSPEKSDKKVVTIEEVDPEVSSSIEAATTATQTQPKAEEPKKDTVGAKWVKKCQEIVPETVQDSVDMAQEVSGKEVEVQLTKLTLSETSEPAVSSSKLVEEPATGERDSANTSPSEVMLASPSLSGYSDTHSEGSSDSGKGCSDVLTPSPTPVSCNSLSGDHPSDIPAICLHEFVIPQHLVGRLIGRSGAYINEIKENTHAVVYIKRHPETTKLKLCAIEGTQTDIDNALDMIRHKFPKKRYPNVTLEQVEFEPELPPVLPEYMQLYLVDGVNNDVITSSLVSAGHLFLQQPTHPTYPSLNRLNSCMNLCYSEPNLPGLPDDCPPGVLCAAPVQDGWYRASVTSTDGTNCDVKFVDYGGFMTIDKSLLRQIRSDFVTLPFQASECFLLGVEPTGDGWSEAAREFVETLTYQKMLSAQIHGYTDSAIPLIYLYTVVDNQVVSVNEQLVEHGYAEWLLPAPVTEAAQVSDFEVYGAAEPHPPALIQHSLTV